MITFSYKNHRGEIALRLVEPVSLDYIPNPDYGYEPGWFLHAHDYTGGRQGVPRSFALTNVQLEGVDPETRINHPAIRFQLQAKRISPLAQDHQEEHAVIKLLVSDPIRLLIGADEWDLTEEEEMLIWGIIKRLDPQKVG